MINYLSSTWQRFFMDILMLLSFPCCTVFLSFIFSPVLYCLFALQAAQFIK